MMDAKQKEREFLDSLSKKIVEQIPQTELNKRIQEKKEMLGDLLTEDACIYLIARELGIEFDIKSPVYENKIYTVSDLFDLKESDSHNGFFYGTLISTVFAVDSLRNVTANTGIEYKIRNVQLMSVMPVELILWGKQAELLDIRSGDIIQLTDFKLTEYKGILQVNQSKFGKLRVIHPQEKQLTLEECNEHSLQEKIFDIIKNSTLKTGISVDAITEELDTISPLVIESELMALINDGRIYQPKPKRYKIL